MDTTLATFGKDVIAGSTLAPVLVDFWAPWCGPCKTLSPMLERLEAEYDGKWKLAKVNVDENQELAAHFQVRSIPHVVAFADGRPPEHRGTRPGAGVVAPAPGLVGSRHSTVTLLARFRGLSMSQPRSRATW